MASAQPVHLGGSVMAHPHYARGFFRSRDEAYRVTLPIILAAQMDGHLRCLSLEEIRRREV